MPRTDERARQGTLAPDFTLTGQDGRVVRLSDLRGQAVVLAFYAGGWDPSRVDQLAHFNALAAAVPGGGAELLGIARDGVWCDLSFTDDTLRVPVLADLGADGTVAELYGVRDDAAVVVVDEAGRVHWRHDGPAPRAAELAAALAALASPGTHAGAAHAPAFGLGQPSRRQFVATTLAAAFALATASVAAKAEPMTRTMTTGEHPPVPPAPVRLRVNGREVALDIEPRVTLLDALREYAGLTATKKGCDHGQCGACTVHVNGRRQLSCLTLAVMHEGDEITTLEGLATGDELSPMQAAFIQHDGFQCGYCTPGQIMSATALLSEPCGPGDDDVKECMSGNICRCGAYPGIVAAIQSVRAQQRGGRVPHGAPARG